ncbi:Prolyl 4-hydroxylase subunit alpha-2 [Orchesella cincta]|uniref:procollagen-proline 4-dioxygenase n=1 Tax=Orchesella cincta TaxID=48709 RepID=A0A1D2NCL9_ORCCI|nr:Prolyl 4-hydroxylase subunit alpha-2 [Orchesella cincta]
MGAEETDYKSNPSRCNTLSLHWGVISIYFIVSFVVIFLSQVTGAFQPYSHTDPDFAASIHHLKLLVLAELNLLPSIFYVANKEPYRENDEPIKLYLDDFTSSNLKSLKAKISLEQFIFLLNSSYIKEDIVANDVVKHPFKSYRTIRRFVRFIGKLPEFTENEDLIRVWNHTRKLYKFPKESDLNASMESIIRLRQVYRFSINDILEGNLEMEIGSGLSIRHMVEIADHSCNLQLYSHAIDLYYGVMTKCSESQPRSFQDCSLLDLANIAVKLNDVIKKHDNLLVEWNDDLAPPDSSPHVFDDILDNITSPKFLSRKPLQIDHKMDELLKTKSELSQLYKDMIVSPFLYEKLCRGEQLRDKAVIASLKCYYSHKSHPIYTIGPLKFEVHSESPPIIQIYDIISDAEISQLQHEVQEEMRQSRTASAEGDDDLGITSRYRTSANAWIEDADISKFTYLNERIARITGLNTTGYFSSEIVQIAAYNPGNHYTPHSDAIFEDEIIKRLPESELQRGDRIMTFMLYLSHVEKGGGTGFPTLKTVIHPVKGSAVMWFNLNPDGTVNYNVLHGGCPVLYGTKWIANKWIRSNDQMFIKRCLNKREEREHYWEMPN